MRGLLAFACCLCIGLALAAVDARADTQDERRVRTGARLFRALLAADAGLEAKIASDGRIEVAVYAPDRSRHASVADLIAPQDAPDQAQVRGFPLRVRPMADLLEGDTLPAAVFLAAPLPGSELEALIRWSMTNRVLLYSPFEGHVERGVMAGLSIEAKVQPFVNRSALEAAQVELRPFFLRVAKVYP